MAHTVGVVHSLCGEAERQVEPRWSVAAASSPAGELTSVTPQKEQNFLLISGKFEAEMLGAH